ncbi:hypothetical protein CBOM_07845 [Ceraceosorus bombacis]|uniref:Uncharacterized protein n=1 Tax=Ceraceosorus bombacis TaxID=401625 RepID=A0A0P1BP09_9BASI|nr:hypothetical protein CBOM_07845 [Ceraceosorus bombacis]
MVHRVARPLRRCHTRFVERSRQRVAITQGTFRRMQRGLDSGGPSVATCDVGSALPIKDERVERYGRDVHRANRSSRCAS